ncbi:MAG TPA: N-formylglutamate amidohydrolase [Geminicoccaceae bacterium]|nr:N-formylglutamate amidohydrolase [Geminicoccaceae bacterium]
MLDQKQSSLLSATPAATPVGNIAAPDDGQLVELANPGGQAPLLLVCDHAGGRIPAQLGDLGLPAHELERHIAFDIGAADLTRRLARLLDAPAVLCHVSRLVVDPNRVPGDPSSIPVISDGTVIPGNQELSRDEIRRRLAAAFIPYHRAVARQIAGLRRRHGIPAIVSIHSFTPHLGASARPWEVAVLWDGDRRLAGLALERLRRNHALQVGDNEPYSGRYPVAYTIPFHAARTGLPHVTFEVRQDLIASRAQAELWADRLAAVLREPLADRRLYRRHLG